MVVRVLPQPISISIHALLAESDGKTPANIMSHSDFYPRSPCGERQTISIVLSMPQIFLSTLSLRRATSSASDSLSDTSISIHALLAESDLALSLPFRAVWIISIHALLAESDWLELFLYYQDNKFLSTLSLRRATTHYDNYNLHCTISIHALLAESDGIGLVFLWWGVRFLSTLSLRRATNEIPYQRQIDQFLSTLSLRRATSVRPETRQRDAISIHALLAESDCFRIPYWFKVTISIHALLAESDSVFFIVFNASCSFLSTLSLRRATINIVNKIKDNRFLSTLSLRRATFRNSCRSFLISYFYPRSPCGERRFQFALLRFQSFISIHALLAESDRQVKQIYQAKISISIHALLAESDRAPSRRLCPRSNFYPRSPCGERLL